MQTQKPNSYRYLTYITGIYTFFFILPSILLKKVVALPVLGVIPISILFTGTYFMILDIVTEVYGFYEARKILFTGLIAYTLFVFTMEWVIHMHSPQHYKLAWSTIQDHHAYRYLFRNLYLVWISVVICTLIANPLNMIILSKWKIAVHGRYFWLRSICTSLVAAILFSVISTVLAFGVFLKASQIPYLIELITISISAKLGTLIICAYPANLICNLLKRRENINVNTIGLTFNPFQKQDAKHEHNA